MSELTPVIRHLGGERGQRSFLGGQHSRGRVAGLAVFVVCGMILTVFAGPIGLAVGGAGVLLTFLVTTRTHRGTIGERVRARRRWDDRLQRGTDAFIPYTDELWDAATVAAGAARGRRARWEAGRELTAIRANPDGADGMGWLQYDRRRPGIALHAPLGETNYLSVTFSVTGPLRGIESTVVMTRAAEAWGQFLAANAAPSALVDGVQVTTRVLPADTALQQAWVRDELDPTAPADAVRSYADVIRLTGDGAMVQRHFITLRWPLTSAFQAAAGKRGSGRDGWRALMVDEIAAATRNLQDARMGEVEVLTARQVSAMILHQQDPDRPIDYVADVHPGQVGVGSHDEKSAHVVDGSAGEWWHRTARIDGADLATAPRTQLWPLELLVGRDLPFIRSIAFHLRLIPAAEAKASAQQDVIRDQAEALSKLERGHIDLDETGTAMSAARRRRADLRAGTGHHGALWTGYITVSVRSRDELATACRQLEDTCATSLGVERLQWQDSYQSSASGCTWPIGRGLRSPSVSLGSRVMRRIGGVSRAKDEL